MPMGIRLHFQLPPVAINCAAGVGQGTRGRMSSHHAAGHCTAKTGHDAIAVALGEKVAVRGRSATCQSVDGHPVLIFLANE